MSATLKSLEAVKLKMNDQQQEFQQILNEFELQKQKFEEEKQQVEQYLAQNDVLHLNVGGEQFCTLQSTLTLIKGTVFDHLFSTNEKLLLDRDNRIFFDYDPKLFRFMLNQLRQWIEVNDDDRLFEMPEESSYDRQRFRNFLRQLKFDEKYFDLQFYNNTHELVGRIVTACSSSDYQNKNRQSSYFYGSHVHSTGCHRIQIKILNVPTYDGTQSYFYMCLGVVKFEDNKKQPLSYYIQWPFHTRLPSVNDIFNEIQSGDVIEIEINCNEKIVTATNQRTMIERHRMLENESYISNKPLALRFCVELENGQGTFVQII